MTRMTRVLPFTLIVAAGVMPGIAQDSQPPTNPPASSQPTLRQPAASRPARPPTSRPGRLQPQLHPLTSSQPASGQTAPASWLGKELPGIKGKDAVTDLPIALADFRDRIVLVHFWAAGDGPVAAILPTIKELDKTYGDKALDIISVAADSRQEMVKKAIETDSMTWYNILDKTGVIARQCGVSSVPSFFVINAKGVVVADRIDGRDLAGPIEKAIAETPPKTRAEWSKEVATAALKNAEDLLAEKKYAAGYAALERITRMYPEAPAAATATKRVAELQADKAVMAEIEKSHKQQLADKDKKSVTSIMAIARAMAEAKKYDAARDLYKRVIKQWPDSEEAAAAKAEMEKLPE